MLRRIAIFRVGTRVHRKPWFSLVHDWNGNGLNEFLYTDGQHFQRVEATAVGGHSPRPPLGLTGESQGPHSIRLRWNRAADADSFRVFRTDTVPQFAWIASTADTSLALSDVATDSTFIYAVSSVNLAFPQSVGAYSNYAAVSANALPSVQDTAEFVRPHFVELRFSEPMGVSAQVQSAYRLDDGRMPATITSGEGGRQLFLSFDGSFVPRWYSLYLRGVRDSQNSQLPASDSMVVFQVVDSTSSAPEVVAHRIVGGTTSSELEITFSQAMDTSVLVLSNYRMDSPRVVISVNSLNEDRSRIHLTLDPRYPIGALGLPARLALRNLRSAIGIPMDTLAGRADLLLGGAAADISEAYVFPNPYKGSGPNGEQCIMFAGLPEKATIRVFTLRGTLVKKIEHENSSGASRWFLDNENHDRVASGVYLYSIEANGQKSRGKLAILR